MKYRDSKYIATFLLLIPSAINDGDVSRSVVLLSFRRKMGRSNVSRIASSFFIQMPIKTFLPSIFASTLFDSGDGSASTAWSQVIQMGLRQIVDVLAKNVNESLVLITETVTNKRP